MPSLLARVCPRGTGDGTRALGLGLTTHLVPWLVCAPYGRAAAGRAPPGTSWGLCLPALAPLHAPKPPLPLGGPAGESGWGRAASTTQFYGLEGGGAPLAGVSRYSPPAMFPRLPRVNRLQIGRPPSQGRRATWRRRSGGGRASTAEGRVREMKSPTDASSICEARISPVATASGDFL